MKFTITIELAPATVATTRDLAQTLHDTADMLAAKYRSLEHGTCWPQVLRNDDQQRIGHWRFTH